MFLVICYCTIIGINMVANSEEIEKNELIMIQNTGIKCNVNLMYEGEYSECILAHNKQLTVPIKITNENNFLKEIVCYIAEYDENGLLHKLVSATNCTLNENESFSTEITKTFMSETKNAKIFIWDSESLQPITGAIILDENENDYYADTAEAAQIYNIQYPIKGAINTENDVDYIRFSPMTSGEYSFNCISATNAVTTLYNSNNRVLITNSSSYKYSLNANEDYYVKVSGDVGAYFFSIQYNVPSEATGFSIYDFDTDTNIYKKSVLNMCRDLWWDDKKEKAKQMYNDYEDILKQESRLHRLPEFLSGHPKDLSNFDEIINQYYSTKYNDLDAIRQQYLDLIDKYTELETEELQAYNSETAK